MKIQEFQQRATGKESAVFSAANRHIVYVSATNALEALLRAAHAGSPMRVGFTPATVWLDDPAGEEVTLTAGGGSATEPGGSEERRQETGKKEQTL